MLTAYKILVFAFTVVGFGAGAWFFIKRRAPWYLATLWWLPLLAIAIFFIREMVLISRSFHLAVIGLGFALYSVSAAVACDWARRQLERHYPFSRLTSLSLRATVVLASALAGVTAAGMIRGICHHLGVARFSPNIRLERLLDAESLAEASMRLDQQHACENLIAALDAAPTTGIRYSDAHSMIPGVRNVSVVGPPAEWPGRVRFLVDADPRQRATAPVFVRYDALDGHTCGIQFGPDVLSREISASKLRQAAVEKVRYSSDLRSEAGRNPHALFAFGLASVGMESGVNGLVLSAADRRAERIDRVLAAFKFFVPIASVLVVTRRP